MTTLDLLEAELILLQDNIKRAKKFIEEEKDNKYGNYNSSIIGELKHRCTAVKKKLSKVNSMSTINFRDEAK